MKITISILLFAVSFVSTAPAVVDPCPNGMGAYFDADADVYEFAAPPYVIVPTHVVLTQPDFAALIGYEFSYEMVGNALITATSFAGTGATDASETESNHIVGLAAPLVFTSEATILTTISVFLLDSNPITFTLRGAVPNSIAGSYLPAVILPGGEPRIIGLSAWDRTTREPGICAIINGYGEILVGAYRDCLLDVSTEPVTWDAIKCMYR